MSSCRVPGAHRAISLGLLLLTLLTPVHFAAAQMGNANALTSNTDWMRWIPDDTSVAALSIPGTHDTMTSGYPTGIPFVSTWVITQTLGLRPQLDAGIRVLDIRARHIGDRFTMHHENYYLNSNFDDVLSTVVQFLKDHPTETILMRVKQEYQPEATTRSFSETFTWYRDQAAYKDFIWGGNYVPALRQVRGRIVILDDFSGGAYGIRWGSIQLQDMYNPDSKDIKWEQARALIDRASGGDMGSLYVNFLSGYIAPVTSPDVMAGTINPRALQYLNEGRALRTGALMMDFPSQELIEAVIALNAQGVIPRPTRDATFSSTSSIDFGVDRVGGDYTAFALQEARPELCRNACLADAPRCTSFNYIKPGVFTRHARCFLKQGEPPQPVSNPNAVSGIAPKSAGAGLSSGLLETNVDRQGGDDYRSFDMTEPVPEQCRDACRNEYPYCQSFSYSKPGLQTGSKARCYLKRSIPTPVPNACCDSGVITNALADAPVSTQGTSIEFNVDRPGQDYFAFEPTEATPRKCLEACFNQADCKAFTYVRPGSVAPKGRCYLKNGVPAPVASTNTDSGTRMARPSAGVYSGLVEANIDRGGQDLQQFDLSEARPEACREACQNNAACRAFTYVKPGIQAAKARCYLKFGVPAPTPSACCDSGVIAR
ncbi:phosphatidylinositol-specific phospholipase C domain-containing protein [Cystobacter fuscus]|uniref:phosphatidylinositol-specific phospholipase C domain-containing protein n=1 Tax=Cystobacter fuscus TaxID=43 RepID=UPI002B295FAD|nr:phosphatidylinositol-specific phospholipase C domain-containing protein [Cystobacter fuscus]